MGGVVKCVFCLWICVQVSRTYDVFEFGSSYKTLSSTIQFIDPGEMAEVCEGDSFMLQCPAGLTILVAPEADIQFGRNGAWEARTRCGVSDEVSLGGQECGTMTARTQLLGSGEGRGSSRAADMVHTAGSRTECRRTGRVGTAGSSSSVSLSLGCMGSERSSSSPCSK